MPETVEYSEGVCADGAAILRDGHPVSIPWIISALESWERHKSDVTRLSARVEELERERDEARTLVLTIKTAIDAFDLENETVGGLKKFLGRVYRDCERSLRRNN